MRFDGHLPGEGCLARSCGTGQLGCDLCQGLAQPQNEDLTLISDWLHVPTCGNTRALLPLKKPHLQQVVLDRSSRWHFEQSAGSGNQHQEVANSQGRPQTLFGVHISPNLMPTQLMWVFDLCFLPTEDKIPTKLVFDIFFCFLPTVASRTRPTDVGFRRKRTCCQFWC